jgi:hypothetical protein
MLHEASFKTSTDQSDFGTREVPTKPAASKPLAAAGLKSAANKPAAAAKPAQKKAVDKPGLAAAHSPKTVDKAALALGKPVTKPVRLAKADPLAPLPDRHSSKSISKTSKDLHTGR